MRVIRDQAVLTKSTTLQLSIWASLWQATQCCPTTVPAAWLFTLFALYGWISTVYVILSLGHSCSKLDV